MAKRRISPQDPQNLQEIMRVGCNCMSREPCCVVNGMTIKNRDAQIDCNVDENFGSIKSIRFINSTVNFIPSGLKVFKNLYEIIIEDGNLIEIQQSDLMAFTQLKNLSLPGNDILRLSKDLFAFNKELQLINLSYNNIRFIHAEIFRDLRHLESLQLDENDCVSCAGYEKEFTTFVIEVAGISCSIDKDAQDTKKYLIVTIAVVVVVICGLLVGGAVFYLVYKNKIKPKVAANVDNGDKTVIVKHNHENCGNYNYGANLNDDGTLGEPLNCQMPYKSLIVLFYRWKISKCAV